MIYNKLMSICCAFAVAVFCCSCRAAVDDTESEESINSSGTADYNYTVIAQAEIDSSMTAFIDTYYQDIRSDLEEEIYVGDVAYIVVKDSDTGRVLASSRIASGLASEFGGSAPANAELKVFLIDRQVIIAVYIPLTGDIVFYRYIDDMYGMHPCQSQNGGSILFKSNDIDFSSLALDGDVLTDGLGNSFEFNFEDFPTTIKTNLI